MKFSRDSEFLWISHQDHLPDLGSKECEGYVAVLPC